MLTQINSSPTQFYTSNESDLSTITQPYTLTTQTTNHQKLSHTFKNPTVVSNFTSPTPYTTKVSDASTTTYIITLT